MKKLATLLASGALLFSVATTFAASVTFDRGLPTDNLNNAAGSDRSNVAWSNGNDYVSGDDFTVGESGEKWKITAIRTWSVAHDGYLGDEFTDIHLYGGSGNDGLTEIANGTLSEGTNDDGNPNITHTAVVYDNTEEYQTGSGSYRAIWQHDFTNLNWVVDGGQKYYFAVDGNLRVADSYYWFNHASKAGLSGSTQDGSDDHWLVWEKSALNVAPIECDSNGPISGICDGGWDKSSDINIQIFATKLDTTAPVITLVEPEDGGTYSGIINLKAECDETCDYINFWWTPENEAFDPADKRYHYVKEDGTEFEWGLNTLAAELWNDGTEAMPDGAYRVYAAGKDLAGNWAKSETITIYVNNTPDDVDQCKKDGWKTFFDPVFKNQGDCVSWLQSSDNALGNKKDNE